MAPTRNPLKNRGAVETPISQINAPDSHSFETVRIETSVKCCVFLRNSLRAFFSFIPEFLVILEITSKLPSAERRHLVLKPDSSDSHSFETVRIGVSEKRSRNAGRLFEGADTFPIPFPDKNHSRENQRSPDTGQSPQ